MFRIKRSDESLLTSWYFEIDRKLLGCVLLLILLSVVFALSAGSVAAERIGRDWHYFLLKAIPFYVTGLIVLFGTSFLTKKQVLWLAAANLLFGLALLPITIV
jgi:cell division protein FtsW